MDEEDKQFLKPLVNNPQMWEILDTYVQKCYNNKQRESDNLTPLEDIYRAQGYIQFTKHLRDLKANVNVK